MRGANISLFFRLSTAVIISILCMLSLSLILSGCSKSDDSQEQAVSEDALEDSSDYGSQDSSDEQAQDQPMQLSTAKESFAAAEALIKKSYSDAVFVGASADMDSSGKSEQWSFYFDSPKRSKGYEVTGDIIRERSFSFQQKIDGEIDSTKAAKVCGAGQATLEAGKWMIADDEGRLCQIDAVSGQKEDIK